MSVPEHGGSLLRGRYDPEFEAKWDRFYAEAMGQDSQGGVDEVQPKASKVADTLGSSSMKSSVEIAAVQQKLFQ